MRALILSADLFEDSELGEPLRLLQTKGLRVDVAAPHKGVITGQHGCAVAAGLALAEVEPADYDLLVLPGGKAPASLRKHERELEAAGAHYLDREVVVDGNLITSRQPADLPAFMQAIYRALGLGGSWGIFNLKITAVDRSSRVSVFL
jgi:protease I